jgi:large subunit ribosomal protein L6
MSRIGKSPIEIPKGVTISVEGQKVTCKGPKGALTVELSQGLNATVDGAKVVVARTEESREVRAMHGTVRALINNMVEGVTKGYEKKLEVVGVGYRAILQGKKVALNVGFANTIEVAIPDGITVKIPDQNHIEVSGIDKQLVGQVAADLRAVRKPEPYKGKGVRYANEHVRRKAGKATTTGAKS